MSFQIWRPGGAQSRAEVVQPSDISSFTVPYFLFDDLEWLERHLQIKCIISIMISIPPGHLPLGAFRVWPIGRTAQENPELTGISQSVLGTPWEPPEWAGGSQRGMSGWPFLDILSFRPDLGWTKDGGCTDGTWKLCSNDSTPHHLRSIPPERSVHVIYSLFSFCQQTGRGK